MNKILMEGKRLPASEALSKMSDAWISGGNCSHQTIMDLKVYAQFLEQKILNSGSTTKDYKMLSGLLAYQARQSQRERGND